MTTTPTGIDLSGTFGLIVEALDRLTGQTPRTDGPLSVKALCPCHDDDNPSLHVTVKAGRILFNCFGECGRGVLDRLMPMLTEQTRGAVTWATLFEEPPQRPTRDKPAHTPWRPPEPSTPPAPRTRRLPCLGKYRSHSYREVIRYPYADEHGTVLGYRVRRECRHDGCGAKTFSWLRYDEHGELVGGMPDPLPLYRLPDVLAAIAEGRPVYVTEGEKDADAVTAAGGVACTMGAADNGRGSTFKAHHRAALAGAPEVIVPADRDKPGHTSARYIARQLLAAGVPIVRVVEAAEGKDVADHLAAGHTLDQLHPASANPEGVAERVDGADMTDHQDMAPEGVGDRAEGRSVDDNTEQTIDLTVLDGDGQDQPPMDPGPEDFPPVEAQPDHVGAGGTFRHLPARGRYPVRLAEVRSKTGPEQDQDHAETTTPILFGTLAVPERYALRGIRADSYPAKDSSGSLYLTRYTTPDGTTYETPITEAELRATRDLEWPGRLGIDPFTGVSGLKRIPDAVRALSMRAHRGEAYTATGLLLRRDVPPVYLRQGLPALTGRLGTYDHGAITQLPGESETLPGVTYLRVSAPSTRDQAGDDLLTWWAWRHATTTDPLALLLLIADLAYAPWSSLPGFLRPALFLDADTGAGKTVLTGLVTGAQSDAFTPTPQDSAAPTGTVESMSNLAARAVLNELRGLVAIIDDFFPKGSSTREIQRQVDLLNVIGRGTRSGAGDLKLTRTGDLRGSKPMRTPILATGEAFTDPKHSQSARFIHARLTPDVLDLEGHRERGERNTGLDAAQTNIRGAARAFSGLIVDGLAALADRDRDRGPYAAQAWAAREVDEWRVPGNNHIPGNYVGVMAGAWLFAERAGAVADLDPAEIRAEFTEAFRRCAIEQGTRSTLRSAVADRYGRDVAEIIRLIRNLILDGHRFRLDGPELGQPPAVPGYALSTFGWREIIREYRDHLGESNTSVSYEPLPRFGNPIGTVHVWQDGKTGRRPTWPSPLTSPVLRLRVDDWQRLYEAATEDQDMHLPDHDEARTLLAASGYLKTAEAKPLPRSGPRVLTLDLGKVLAGEDGPETGSDGADGQLATPDGPIGDAIGDATTEASPQVNELATLATLATSSPPHVRACARDGDAGTCPECNGPREADRNWPGAVCLTCLDRSRTPDAPRCRTCAGAITPGRAARSPYCWGCEPPPEPEPNPEPEPLPLDDRQEPPGATRSRQGTEPARDTARGRQRAAQRQQEPGTGRVLAVLSHTGARYVLHRESVEPVELDQVDGTRAGIHALALAHNVRALAVHASAAGALGWPTAPPNMTARGAAVAAEGWSAETLDELDAFPAGGVAAWVTVWTPGPDGDRVSPVGVHIPCLDDRPAARWNDASDGPELLAALVAFREATGDSYYYSPNATAVQIARRHSRSLAIAELPPPALRDSGEGFRRAMITVQSRPLDDVEDSHIFVHEFDANGQHIAAMGGELFGGGTATHVTAPAFDPRLAGYWRIENLTGWDPRMPRLTLDDGAWIVTATGKMLRDLGCAFDVTEAWVYPKTHRPLFAVYETYRKARVQLLDAESRGVPGARIARKSLPYATFTGWLSRKDGPGKGNEDLYRPDWHDVILAEADARLLRRAHRIGTATGRWPVGVRTDALYYTSDELDPLKAAPAGLPIGEGLGQFKPEGTAPLAAIRSTFGENGMHRAFDSASGVSE